MATIRSIKKDIDYLTGEVISDCFTFMYLYPEKKREETMDIINDAADLRNTLRERVNAKPEGKAKQHFNAIFQDLLKGVDEQFKRISELTK